MPQAGRNITIKRSALNSGINDVFTWEVSRRKNGAAWTVTDTYDLVASGHYTAPDPGVENATGTFNFAYATMLPEDGEKGDIYEYRFEGVDAWLEDDAIVRFSCTYTISLPGIGQLLNTLKRKKKIMSMFNYPISNDWLNSEDPTAPAYCDIEEIRNDPAGNAPQPANILQGPVAHGSSAYLDWVLSNDPRVFTRADGSTPSRTDHIIAARFHGTGIRISNTDISGKVKGILANSSIITKGEFFGGVEHSDVYKRIYRNGTEARDIWFVGV